MLDRCSYTPAFHDPSIPDTRGISLERLTPAMAATSSANWYSASAACGYATPGKPNSQQSPNPLSGSKVAVEPSWITPIGYDLHRLAYVSFDDLSVGTKATILVTAETGQIVRHLLCEGGVASGDRIPWDGNCNFGTPCPGGVYIVHVLLSDGIHAARKMRFPVVVIR